LVVLRVKGLRKTYYVPAGIFSPVPRQVHALRGVSLDIGTGMAMGLVGESGSGKSTFAKLVLKLIDADEGSMIFQGQDVRGWSERRFRPLRRKIQIVFQDPLASLSPRLRVRQIIGEPLGAMGMGRQEILTRVGELMAQVGLHESLRERLPHQLSGGQRQRVSIARALASKPELVVLDEAVSSLDVSTQAQILNLLKDLQDTYATSYLFIGHNLSVVRVLCHEVAVMYQGTVVEQGPTEEVYRHPGHPYTKLLLQSMPRLARSPGAGFSRAAMDRNKVLIPEEDDGGCRWRATCRLADARCVRESPPACEVGRRHRVWCWHCGPAAAENRE
jgi:oligopeptide/dipeptide ABC transporter ATP-binding protein